MTKLLVFGITAATVATLSVKAAVSGVGLGGFALELNGVNAGAVRSIEGGDLTANVVTVREGTGTFEKKHIAGVKYEDFTMQIGAGMDKSVYDWISATFDGHAVEKDGAISVFDMNYGVRERGTFMHALISEVTMPACDASSKDPAYLTVKFSPELVRWTPGDSKQPTPISRKQKQWLASNFRLDIPGLDCSRVTKIEAFTIKQKLSEVSDGSFRNPAQVATGVEFPNLRVTIQANRADTWLKWADDFIVGGNSGSKQEKEGSLTFLSPDFSEELVRVGLHHLGIFKVHRSLSEAKNGVATLTVDLYVNAMEIDFMAQFEN